MKRAILVMGLLTLLVCAAYAQQPVTANIPFEFVAAKATLPAGNYEFRSIDVLSMQVRNTETGKTVIVPILTRLGSPQSGVAHVSFDNVGGKMILESLLPGTEDGYLLNTTKQKHTHKLIKLG